MLRWVRRSRDGWAWRDGLDPPIAEDAERYRVTRTAGATVTITDVATPSLVYTAAERAGDAATGAASAQFAIAQLGSAGVSPAATLSISTS